MSDARLLGKGFQDREMNNLVHWFPMLRATGVPVPRTRVVRGPSDLIKVLDGHPVDGMAEFIDRLKDAADSLTPLGGPVFLRTGHLSDKHSWKDTCYVDQIADMRSHVLSLVESSALADLMGFPTEAWVVREFLDLDARFVAFHGDMPINVEVRYFVGGGRVLCKHPYWPEEAFEECSFVGWEDKLRGIYHTIEEESSIVDEMAGRVAEFFHGWSVDFARTKSGQWYAIDMALARHSYHWSPCPSTTTS